jgi:hypothetical protein
MVNQLEIKQCLDNYQNEKFNFKSQIVKLKDFRSAK